MPSDSGRLSDPGTKEVCGRFGNVSAALLLGGASSRMGTDKAALELGGVPFAVRTARLLDRLFDELWLVGGTPPPEAPGRHVADAAGPRCALRGLVTALESATRERVLVLATDLPLVSPDLLLALVAWPEQDVVVPRRDGRRHPLCAIYRRERVLTAARRRLAGDELRMGDLLGELSTAHLEGEDLLALDPDGSALFNVNTPADLARARELLAAGAASETAARWGRDLK